MKNSLTANHITPETSKIAIKYTMIFWSQSEITFFLYTVKRIKGRRKRERNEVGRERERWRVSKHKTDCKINTNNYMAKNVQKVLEQKITPWRARLNYIYLQKIGQKKTGMIKRHNTKTWNENIKKGSLLERLFPCVSTDMFPQVWECGEDAYTSITVTVKGVPIVQPLVCTESEVNKFH